MALKISDMSITTLGEFILEEQKDFPDSSGELSSILSSIRLAGKIVSNQIKKLGSDKKYFVFMVWVQFQLY